MSSSNIPIPQMYDDVGSDYDAVRTNILNVKYEEPMFWKLIGDIQQKYILDLACGSGHYSRKMIEKGAKLVVGVDISERMISEAQTQEENDKYGIQYLVGDAASLSLKENNLLFDIVTAQYLLCHAETEKQLQEFSKTAFAHLKSGGKFVAITTIYSKEISSPDGQPVNGCLYRPTNKQGDVTDSSTWYDGMPVNVTLFSDDMKKTCSLRDHVWLPSTIKSKLMDVGFTAVDEHRLTECNPEAIFVAFKD